MRPNYFDDPVIDELGNIHTLEEYCSGSGGDISNTPVTFTSDDNIQNPDTSISMPLFKSGNVLKDLMRWISKAFHNIRYLLKKVSDLDSDITINTEKIGDIEEYTAKIWTNTTVALAGEFYQDENKIWKCLVDNSHKPSEGVDWTQVKVMDEVSELNDALSEKISNLDLIEYIFGVVANEYDGTSLNDYQNAGVFLVKNSTDHPIDVSNSGKIIVIKTAKTSNNYMTQIYFPNYSQPYTRHRYYSSGSGWIWSQWFKIGS